MSPKPHMAGPRPRLHRASWLFGLLGMLAVVAVAIHLGDIERFVSLLRSLAPQWLALALLLQWGTYLCVAVTWQQGLRRMDKRLSLRRLLPLSLAKLLVDQTVPTGGLSGTAFLVAALERRGVAPPACLAALLATLIGHYAAYLLAALTGAAVLWATHGTRRWMIGVFAAFFLVSTLIPLGLLALRKIGRREVHWLDRIPAIASLLEATAQAPLILARSPILLLEMTGLSLAVIVLDTATLWVMLQALHLHTALALVFPAFVLAMMVTTIGPIPLGLGSFEATCVTMLTLHGVPIEGALTATLLLRGFTTWLPMLPGLFLTRREWREPRPLEHR